MEYGHIRVDYPIIKDDEGNITKGVVDGNYAVIVLNRPDRLNALTEQTVSEITHALRGFEVDVNVRAVVIRGTKDFPCKPIFSNHLSATKAALASHPESSIIAIPKYKRKMLGIKTAALV